MTSSAPKRASWGFVFVAVSAVLFGSIGVATKGIFTVAETNPLSITLWRSFIALPVLFIIGFIVLDRKLFLIRQQDLPLMIFAGLTMAMYQAAFVVAVQVVNVTIATLVTLCTVPVCAALISGIVLRERVHRNIFFAMACAIVGVVLLIGFQPIANFGANVWLGIGMALLTAISSAFFQVIGRKLSTQYHPLQSLTVFSLVATLALAPVALWNGFQTNYPPAGWILLVHLGIGISVVAYIFLLLGLHTTQATIATIIGLLEPLTGTILAVLIFGEELSAFGLFGAALLLAAIVIVWRTNTQVEKIVME
jgi:DME family drug/metabolite transporter